MPKATVPWLTAFDTRLTSDGVRIKRPNYILPQTKGSSVNRHSSPSTSFRSLTASETTETAPSGHLANDCTQKGEKQNWKTTPPHLHSRMCKNIHFGCVKDCLAFYNQVFVCVCVWYRFRFNGVLSVHLFVWKKNLSHSAPMR